jgi:hypothetical protein
MLAPAIVMLLALLGFPAAAAAPKAVPPYKLSVFVQAPAGLSAPDSIAVLDSRVFVGYGDGHAPDGSDGKDSQVVEYRTDGTIVHVYQVRGHNDGLKVDPTTGRLWALQNEDANPRLVIIDPTTRRTKTYTFGPTLHGGGYDDIVFLGGKVYISASNPAHNPNTGPAIVSAVLRADKVVVAPLLQGTARAIDIPTGTSIRLNLQDPDSMTVDPLGDIVLDSQSDQELIIVTDPGAKNQRALRLPLSYETAKGAKRVQADDTAFATSGDGYILFADKKLNKVFLLQKEGFAPGAVYTAANGGPFVGTLDLTSGVITPVVTGLMNPGGLVFVDTSDPGSGGR